MTPAAAKKIRLKAFKAEHEELANSIRELNGDVRFQRYTAGLYNLKDLAVGEACQFETLNSPTVTAGAIGRIQAIQDMIDLIESQPVALHEVESEQTQ